MFKVGFKPFINSIKNHMQTSSPFRRIKESTCCDEFVKTDKSIIPSMIFEYEFSVKDTHGEFTPPKTQYVTPQNMENCKFLQKYKPITLKCIQVNDLAYDADNLSYPNGTIAIPSSKKDLLTTSGMWQCAAIAIVDKKQDLQTIVHYCENYPKIQEVNYLILDYITSFSNPKDLEITIVPGCYEETNQRIDSIVKYFKERRNIKNIRFANFPNGSSTLAIKDGKVFCLPYGIRKPIYNPINKIIASKPMRNY
ncbi:MAG: hypothetical protein IJ003_06530 [Candidatus Gastranaerophilales bacterium]|nr:hypothetical protein [Candidatus Gastranaerophilales bacterium]